MQTQYFDNGDRSEKTYLPEQHPDAYSQAHFYSDGHSAGGRVQFDGYGTRLVIGGNDMAGDFYGSPRDAWLQAGVTYVFDEPEAIVIVGPITPSEEW